MRLAFPPCARIVDNRYRWSSYTPSDNLRFDWRLIKTPMSVLDYVLVHELAHLLESNHTPRFWSIVSAPANDFASMGKALKKTCSHARRAPSTLSTSGFSVVEWEREKSFKRHDALRHITHNVMICS